jgi:hypothetical protein
MCRIGTQRGIISVTLLESSHRGSFLVPDGHGHHRPPSTTSGQVETFAHSGRGRLFGGHKGGPAEPPRNEARSP